MSELIDRIPGQESLLGKLHGVVDTTMQIKARQRLTGRGGQLAYAAENDTDWDYTATLAVPTPPTFSEARFRVLFTADDSQTYPIAIPMTDIRINGTADVNRLTSSTSSGRYGYDDGVGEILGEETIDQPNPDYFGTTDQLGWEFYFQYRKSVTIRIKARAQASCPGTFTVTRIL